MADIVQDSSGGQTATQSDDGRAGGLLALAARPWLLLALMLVLGAGCGVLGYMQADRGWDAAAVPEAAPPVQPQVALPGKPAVETAAAQVKGASDGAPPWPLWEYKLDDPVPARDPPLTAVDWKLLGATLSNGRWEIVVMRQGKTQPEYFKTGDKLPGGYLIRDINQENVTLSAGRRQIVLAYIGSR